MKTYSAHKGMSFCCKNPMQAWDASIVSRNSMAIYTARVTFSIRRVQLRILGVDFLKTRFGYNYLIVYVFTSPTCNYISKNIGTYIVTRHAFDHQSRRLFPQPFFDVPRFFNRNLMKRCSLKIQHLGYMFFYLIFSFINWL